MLWVSSMVVWAFALQPLLEKETRDFKTNFVQKLTLCRILLIAESEVNYTELLSHVSLSLSLFLYIYICVCVCVCVCVQIQVTESSLIMKKGASPSDRV